MSYDNTRSSGMTVADHDEAVRLANDEFVRMNDSDASEHMKNLYAQRYRKTIRDRIEFLGLDPDAR